MSLIRCTLALLLYAYISTTILAQVRIDALSMSFEPNELNRLTAYNAQVTDINDKGIFGPKDGAFVINDVEGRQCSPPFSVTNGMNDNRAFWIQGPAIARYCNVSIEVKVSLSSAPFEDCALKGQINPFGCTDFVATGPGGDGFAIEIRQNSKLVLKGGYCGDSPEGDFSATGLDIEFGDILQVFITGGTQTPDESYYIEDIAVIGSPQSLIEPQFADENITLCANTEALILNEISNGDSYKWYHNGSLLTGQNSAQYIAAPVSVMDAGTYKVEVTHGSCTAEAEATVTVNQCTMVPDFTFDSTYCQSDTIYLSNTAPNGVQGSWRESTPFILAGLLGRTTLQFTTNAGNTFDYTFEVLPTYTTLIDQKLCIDGTVTVNGNVYDRDNPSGTEYILSTYQCDSIVKVQLSFLQQDTVYKTIELCPGEQTQFRNVPISSDISQLSILEGPNGCDTLFLIDVINEEPDTTKVTLQLCEGSDTTIAGIVFDRDKQTETISFATNKGCGDSTVIYTIEISSDAPTILTDTLYSYCDGQEIRIGGQLFTPATPVGKVFYPRAGQCDSIVDVNIIFYETEVETVPEIYNLCPGDEFVLHNVVVPYGFNGVQEFLIPGRCDSVFLIEFASYENDTTEIRIQLCPGEDTTLFGVTFDLNNNTNAYVSTSSSTNSCDSTIHIIVEPFSSIETTSITDTLCQNQTFTILGQTFDINNPTGQINTISQNGCDSIINVNLTFLDQINTAITDTLCQNQTFTVLGQTFDINNPTGQINTISQNGCDSIINVNLTFLDQINTSITDTLCQNQTLSILGQTFDINNPTGQINTISQNGCDSIINVNLTFLQEINTTITDTLCQNQTLSILGRTFDINNPTGQINTISQNGCDSIINVNLTFLDQINTAITDTLCQNQTLTVLGQTFDINNPTGQINTISQNGCDSIINVNLTFVQESIIRIDTSLCQGDVLNLFGNDYDQSVIDTITRTGAMCDSLIIITVSIDEPPAIEFVADTITCDIPTSVIMPITDAQVTSWSGPLGFSSTERNIEASEAGSYTVSYEYKGCSYSSTFALASDLSTPTIELITDQTTLCHDNDPLLLSADTDGMIIGWTKEGKSISSTAEASIDQPGVYVFSALGNNGCLDSVEVSIGSSAQVMINSKPISSNRYELSFDYPHKIDQITWTASTGTITCSDCITNLLDIDDTTQVVLTIVDDFGCSSSDTITLLPSNIAEPVPNANVYLPNAISISSRKGNGLFYPIMVNDKIQYDIDIYNRWGNKIFEARKLRVNDPTGAWTGRLAGEELQAGVYTYQIILHKEDGREEVIMGDVSIIH